MLSVFLENPNELRAAPAEHFACVAIRVRLVRGIWSDLAPKDWTVEMSSWSSAYI